MKWKSALICGCVVVALSCDNDPVPLTAEEQLAADVALIDEYLAENQITAVKHVSGLRYVITKEGPGEKPTSEDCVRIDYAGRMLRDTEPFETGTGVAGPMPNFIKGWRIGLKEVRKGGAITLYIPSGMAYGTFGSKKDGVQVIPANAILVFAVTVHNITKYNSAGQYCYPWP
jgi:FKBP-type peptidyl-prolyl cis-trans isomerase FkpA